MLAGSIELVCGGVARSLTPGCFAVLPRGVPHSFVVVGLDVDARLSSKTRFDYRLSADSYLRQWLGAKRLRDVTPEVLIAWQRRLGVEGGRKRGQGLAPNTIRLARAPLAGAFKAAIAAALVSHNPLADVPRPTAPRSIPQHWSPEQARELLDLEEGDRMWPVWAFLLGSGLRIGELVWLRWSNVELERRAVRVVEFASTDGYEVKASVGKSFDAVRTIELDDGLSEQRFIHRQHRGRIEPVSERDCRVHGSATTASSTPRHHHDPIGLPQPAADHPATAPSSSRSSGLSRRVARIVRGSIGRSETRRGRGC